MTMPQNSSVEKAPYWPFSSLQHSSSWCFDREAAIVELAKKPENSSYFLKDRAELPVSWSFKTNQICLRDIFVNQMPFSKVTDLSNLGSVIPPIEIERL